MKDKALNLLGLMRRANALSVGETDTGAAARSNTAVLVLLAGDASKNAESRARGFVYGRDIPLITLPFTKEEISERLGKNGCSMAAIRDYGFADAFLKLMTEISPGEYDEPSREIAQKLERETSKRPKTVSTNKKRIGLRRNNT